MAGGIRRVVNVEAGQPQERARHVDRGNPGQELVHQRLLAHLLAHLQQQERRGHAEADGIAQAVQFAAELAGRARQPGDVAVQHVEDHGDQDEPARRGEIIGIKVLDQTPCCRSGWPRRWRQTHRCRCPASAGPAQPRSPHRALPRNLGTAPKRLSYPEDLRISSESGENPLYSLAIFRYFRYCQKKQGLGVEKQCIDGMDINAGVIRKDLTMSIAILPEPRTSTLAAATSTTGTGQAKMIVCTKSFMAKL